MSCCPDALNQNELFCCNISWCVWIFNKAQQLLNMPPHLCVCVCDQCYSNEPDKPKCHQCLQLGRCQPEWPSSPPDWCWTQICWRWAVCPVPPVPGQAAGVGRGQGPHTSSTWLWTDLVEWRWTEIEVRQDRQETWETKQLRKCRSTGGGTDKPVRNRKLCLRLGKLENIKEEAGWKNEKKERLHWDIQKENWDETLQAENREVKENRLQRKLGHILNCSKPTLFSFSFQIWKHNTKLKPNIKDNMETAEAEPLKRQSAWLCNHSRKLSQAVRTNLMKDGWWLLC